MTFPYRQPRDAVKPIRDYLVTELGKRDPSIGVGLMLPSGWSVTDPTYVVVFDDSGPSEWPILTRPLIRVTVWASGRSRARQVAAMTMGLVGQRGIPGIAQVERNPSAILDAQDPTNFAFLASWTVRVIARNV